MDNSNTEQPSEQQTGLVRISSAWHEVLKEQAKQRRQSIRTLVEIALENYFGNLKGDNKEEK